MLDLTCLKSEGMRQTILSYTALEVHFIPADNDSYVTNFRMNTSLALISI